MYFAAISQLQELALSLSLKCLSFDFVGTSVDESSDEFGTVQVSACLNIFINFVFGSTISFLLCWFIYYPVIWWFADSISLETSFGRFFNATTIFWLLCHYKVPSFKGGLYTHFLYVCALNSQTSYSSIAWKLKFHNKILLRN